MITPPTSPRSQYTQTIIPSSPPALTRTPSDAKLHAMLAHLPPPLELPSQMPPNCPPRVYKIGETEYYEDGILNKIYSASKKIHLINCYVLIKVYDENKKEFRGEITLDEKSKIGCKNPYPSTTTYSPTPDM